MKVAICFWGLFLRSLDYTRESIYRYVFSVLQRENIDFDVYIHTYIDPDNRAYTASKEFNPKSLQVDDQIVFDKSINVSDYAYKGDPWEDHFTSLKNSLRALNSQYQLSKAIKKSGILYDFVIFIRPDVRYLNELPVKLLGTLGRQALLVPDFHRSCDGGMLNDR
jgi:hypothetical protein